MHNAYLVRAHPANAKRFQEESSVKQEPAQIKNGIQEDQTLQMKKKISSNLLHQRMGHKSLPVLLNASKHEVWKDTRMGFEHDAFCEGCKVSTLKKINKGKITTVEALKVTKPGQLLPWTSFPTSMTMALLQAIGTSTTCWCVMYTASTVCYLE